MNDEPPYINVLGCRTPVLDLATAVAETERRIRAFDGRCHHGVNTGFHGIWEGQKNPTFKAMLNDAEFWVPDGIAYALIARSHGYRMKRLAGPDYVKAMLERSCVQGYRQYFYGDTEATLKALDTKLRAAYPALRIAGMRSPPFRALTPEEDRDHIARINAAKPDILWVGLGCPKQERWIYEHKAELHVPVAIGIGAIFRFLSGTVVRAPDWIGRIGLEWLWRLTQEPGKCWRRCLIDGPGFMAAVLKDSLDQKRKTNNTE